MSRYLLWRPDFALVWSLIMPIIGSVIASHIPPMSEMKPRLLGAQPLDIGQILLMIHADRIARSAEHDVSRGIAHGRLEGIFQIALDSRNVFEPFGKSSSFFFHCCLPFRSYKGIAI